MFVTRIEADGLRHAPRLSGLDRTPSLPAPPAAVAVADALRLFTVAVDPSRATSLRPLGWVGASTEPLHDDDTQRVDMLLGLLPGAVRRSLEPDVRSVAVDVSMAPDPPLYGRLREHAVRDPRLVTALGQEAELHVKAGWLLTSDRASASPDLLGARMGDVSFPLAGKERPAWLLPLLVDLVARIAVVDPDEPLGAVTDRLFAAAISHRSEPRRAWARAAAALSAPPFDLPTPEWVTVDDGLTLAFGEHLLAPRQLGRRAAEAVRLVEATIVRAPDVLVVPMELPDDVVAWLHAHTDGDEATLEQVFA